MAYDLLTRRQTSTNWSRHSYLGPRARLRSGRMLFLASYEFAPDPTPTTDEERQFIAKLAVLKMNADGGNKKAAKEWKATMAKVAAAKKKADSGDPKAKRLMTVLNESGLFDGVQSMSVTGNDPSDDELEKLMLKALPWKDNRTPEQIEKAAKYSKRWDALENLYLVSRKDPTSNERKTINLIVRKARGGDQQAKEDVSALQRIRYHAGDAKFYPGSLEDIASRRLK